MNLSDTTQAIQVEIALRLRTGLLLRSGLDNVFADNTIEKTNDGRNLHINGYVWAGLLRRAIGRLKEGQVTAARIGKYRPEGTGKDKAARGVSPLWCEATFYELHHTDINPGNKISRKWGSTATGALYNEEIVPPGPFLSFRFHYFLAPDENAENLKKLFLDAFWVIAEGVETIGGGWSYGHGSLDVCHIRMKDLTLTEDRSLLWRFDHNSWDTDMTGEVFSYRYEKNTPEVSKPWTKIVLHCRIADGQLLAIHTATPPLNVETYDDLPDHYVFVRNRINADGKSTAPVHIITGKAFRQAILSTAIERKLRTIGDNCCNDTASHRREEDHCPGCRDGNPCKRRRWFGGVDGGGIVSVADAEISGYEKHILHRIALCEHSMQNINLFSGEYLSGGSFDIKILVDMSRADVDNCSDLLQELKTIFKEMQLPKEEERGKAPRGWHRLGATSTCTGQIDIIDWSKARHG